MWADAQRHGRPAEYRGRSLRKFRNSIPYTTRKVWLTPAAGVPCSNAANIGKGKTWTQSEFCTWQNSVRGQEPPIMYIVYQPRRRPNIVQSLVGFRGATSCSNEANMRNPLKFGGVPQTPELQHISKFTLRPHHVSIRPHHVWKYGRHPISDRCE